MIGRVAKRDPSAEDILKNPRQVRRTDDRVMPRRSRGTGHPATVPTRTVTPVSAFIRQAVPGSIWPACYVAE